MTAFQTTANANRSLETEGRQTGEEKTDLSKMKLLCECPCEECARPNDEM